MSEDSTLAALAEESYPKAMELIMQAISEGLDVVRDFEAKQKKIKRYKESTELGYQITGFPYYSSKTEGLPDYGSIFNDHKTEEQQAREESGEFTLFPSWFMVGGDSIPSSRLASWNAFLDFGKADPYLSKYWTPDRLEIALQSVDDGENIIKEHIRTSLDKYRYFDPLRNLLNRYIHVTGNKEFNAADFRPILKEWLTATYYRKLPFDLYVPILAQTFPFESLQISENFFIEEMGDDVQLARNQAYSYRSINKEVARMATHALVMKNWQLPNDTREERQNSLNNIYVFSEMLVEVNRFITFLRVVTGTELGYAQVIIKHNGWADHWTTNLIPVHVLGSRAYPDHFDERMWYEKPEPIKESDCNEAAGLYKAVVELSSKKMDLAIKRLNRASLRAEEADSILDIAIGLEVLLLDNKDNAEVTHKLATRLAALSRLQKFEDNSPQDVFQFCKRIYAFRSAIAHGKDEKEVQKTRVITIAKEKTLPTVDLGIKLLGFAIRVLTKHPEFIQDYNLLDRFLVGGDTVILSTTINETSSETKLPSSTSEQS